MQPPAETASGGFYDVIVAGGGLAGLTAAACLSQRGYRTLLLEKEAAPGGLAQTFFFRGFSFDAGLRALENAGVLLPLCRELELGLALAPDPVYMGVEGYRVRLDTPDGPADYFSLLALLFPQQQRQLQRIAADTARLCADTGTLYGGENPLLHTGKTDAAWLFREALPLCLRSAAALLRLSRAACPAETHLRRFTDDDALIDLLIQHFFPATPASFALGYFRVFQDYLYPRGGVGALAEALAARIRASGGALRTRQTVCALDLPRRCLTTSGGVYYRYRSLIWAADQRTLYTLAQRPLLRPEPPLLAQAGSGDSILTVYFAADLAPAYFESRCGARLFYTPSRQGLSSLPAWEAIRLQGPEACRVWLAHYLARTTYEISCPVLRDAMLAPPGQTGVIVSTRLDYGIALAFAAAEGEAAFRQRCADTIADVLQASLFPGWKSRLLFAQCATPLTLERRTGNAHGAITGWAFTQPRVPAATRLTQLGRAVRTPFPDIFQCGQWTLRPSGLPVSLLTGRLAADAAARAL